MNSVTYDQFSSMDIRVATVLVAEVVENADKLLKLTLDVGSAEEGGLGQRTIVSGIRPWFKPEELVGRQIVYLANLEPRVIRGVESQGMILAAGADTPVLLAPSTAMKSGEKIR